MGALRGFPGALALLVAGCSNGGSAELANGAAGGNGAPAGNRAAAAAASLDGSTVAPALPPCPFERTREWIGAIENGRLNVTGRVDLQMAGFRPTLTERRASGPGTIAFDLTLSPAAGAAVTDVARYQRAGVSPYRTAEVYCGGRRIASIRLIQVG
ncbi:hypothetical protein GCM10023232_28100 [Sphingosinicella ginsenosidimutans]|uniref:Lipoprotein n=1 Tax=Allosphingosinicella ginsenosidimutans TaxID=1176539 RepID=A0A5C6TSM4_9SPHN|nr:hypothetical protein [Sphingosinicella ginsenosidimutans]TXC63170.1 hypothetical protein FRZ32_05545 [Sphingosinicella ginsenosidimutans]